MKNHPTAGNSEKMSVGSQSGSTAGRAAGPDIPTSTPQDALAFRLEKMLERMEAEAGPIPEDIQRDVDALDWPA